MPEDKNICSKDEELNKEQDEAYEIFLKLRDTIFENKKEQLNLFGKNILYIAAGFFAIIPIYLDKIFDLEVACGIGLFYAAMLLFGISILSTLWAFFAAACCSEVCLKQLDNCWESNKEIISRYCSWLDIGVRILNWISLCAFSFAMLFVLLFFLINS